MRLSNYILYGTTAIIFCLAVGYSVYIAFNVRSASRLRQCRSKRKPGKDFRRKQKTCGPNSNQAVAARENAEKALSKATEVSKNRNGEIAKLEEQLANLKAANKSPTDGPQSTGHR